MFCPDCGTENVNSQKFCVRCGSNLLLVDRAREILGEVSANSGGSEGYSPQLFQMIALISICGFICVTVGSIFLMLIDRGRSPIPALFGVGGFGSLVLICGLLLRMGKQTKSTPKAERSSLSHVMPPVPRKATNRALNANAIGFQSITEDSTRQFEKEY